MSGFKLIGIRPHKDCGKKYLKLLEPGRLYQFYNEYEFSTEDGKFDGLNGEIAHFSINKTVPDDLFKIGELKINISAVVGKNGTGKSTLIELLLYCIYYLGLGLEDAYAGKILKPYHTRLEEEERLLKEKKSSLNENNKKFKEYVKSCIIDRSKKSKDPDDKLIEQLKSKIEELFNSKDTLDKLEKDIKICKELIKLSKKSNDALLKEFKCSVLYDLNGILIELNINTQVDDESKITFKIVKNKTSNETNEISRNLKIDSLLYPESYELLRIFFYSVFLNYSHHSLNSNHLGDWIQTLFHKNDGYKTPAVINPMREDGNFDINTENNLAKNRLLTNLLIKRFKEKNEQNNKSKKTQVTEKQYVQFVSFKYDKIQNKRNLIKLGNKKSNNLNENFLLSGNSITTNLILDFLAVNKEVFDDGDQINLQNNQVFFSEALFDYIAYKVPRILRYYPEYGSHHKTARNQEIDTIHYYRDALLNLTNDNSHVSFKYHRVIYFLKKILEGKIVKWKYEEQKVYFSLDELLDWMEINEEKDLFSINLKLPPPIFDIDFVFETESSTDFQNDEILNSKPKFSDLSSGEQQSIHSINSLIYHLNNAYSVHLKLDDINRIKYGRYNVIFDEIELYFHPDLQRKFINDLLRTIESYSYLVDGKFVKGLNILFSTHSPFILSDIPEQNILLLEYGLSSLSQDKKMYSISVTNKNQTFGSNIHDLLRDSFFMDSGLIGSYAKFKINEVINYLGDNRISLNSKKFNLNAKKTAEIVNLIGEPVLQDALKESLEIKKRLNVRKGDH